MSAIFFWKGLLLGFSIAAPVGPIGVLCIRRTLQYGRLSGLFSGLGASVADTVYGLVSALGLTWIATGLIAGKFWLQCLGGLFLIYLGLKTFFSKPEEKQEKVSHRTWLGDFVSTFFLTLTNPMTILSFVAVFAGLGLVSGSGNAFDAFGLVGGVFVGSALWWVILSEGVALFRKKMSRKVMRGINRVAGGIILGFGVFALLDGFASFISRWKILN